MDQCRTDFWNVLRVFKNFSISISVFFIQLNKSLKLITTCTFRCAIVMTISYFLVCVFENHWSTKQLQNKHRIWEICQMV